jgi:ribulose-phosphate 3-epimerase
VNQKLIAHISPSILNANFDDLENEIKKVTAESDFLHLDIMDNKFVPNFTFDLDQAAQIIKISSLKTDAHLMIAEPDYFAPKYAEKGAYSVTFHFEAAKEIPTLISNIRSNGAKVGLAIKPKTAYSEIAKYLPDIDMLLIMTVEPGFGGQSFMADQLGKVIEARSQINALALDHISLQVDGGISEKTIGTAAKAGADCFVAGSAVYNDAEPAKMVTKLRKLANAQFT